MNHASRNCLLLLSILISGTALAQEPAAKRVDFSHDVVPILKQHCLPCHRGTEPEGDFSFGTRESLLAADVVVPGKAADSRLWELVTSTDPDDQMPPEGKTRLSPTELNTLKRWIDGGVKWEEGFTFASPTYTPPLKPRRPELPPVHGGREHPIDRIIDAYLSAHDVDLPRPINDATFLRRVSFDLLGLPPSPDELAAFLNDRAPGKRERMIDQLLARDRDYAAHWMTYWNDLLRNAYSGTGFIDGGRKQITGWLYQSLLQNKPYDRFVRELLAPTPESEGFIRGIKWRGNVNASQRREIQFAQSVSQVMLGINMKCASCHDSFIDRWTLNEAYSLAAIYSQQPLEIHRCDKPTGEIATPAWLFPELGQIDPQAAQPERLKQLARLMTHRDNGRFTRTIANRIWRQFMGRGIVHPVDAMQTQPWNEDLLDYLALDLSDHDYDLKQLMRRILTSQAYQSQVVVLPQQVHSGDFVYRGPILKRLTAEQFLDAVRAVTRQWPRPNGKMLKPDGRGQGGQLSAVLRAEGTDLPWGNRPLRTVFTETDSLQTTLGRPNREQIVSVRPETVTTLEAIHLSNGPVLAKILREAAEQMNQASFDESELIEQLFQHALARRPTDQERLAATELLNRDPKTEGIEDLLWAVFLLPEFQFLQ